MFANKLEIVRGDTVTYTLNFVNSDDSPKNLTNCEVFFTVKKYLSDSDDNAIIKKDFSNFNNPASGIAILELTHTETNVEAGEYYFDMQLKNSDGKIYTIMNGIYNIIQDVTLRSI